MLAAIVVVLIVGAIAFGIIGSDRHDSTVMSPEANAPTLLRLGAGSGFLGPAAPLVSLDGLAADRIAVGPDGTIVVATDPTLSPTDTMSLQVVGPDGALRDIGISVPPDARFAFGPGGDFYVQWTLTTPNGQASATVVRWTPRSSGAWSRVVTETGGYAGTCGFVVTPVSVGCAQGFGLVFDPPLEFDRVDADPAIASVQRLGGAVRKNWFTALELDQDATCTNPACNTLFAPGPDGSAIWYPDIAEPPYTHAVFVLDERSTAGAAWLDPTITDIVGVAGRSLVAVQTVEGTTSLVTVDLTPILSP